MELEELRKKAIELYEDIMSKSTKGMIFTPGITEEQRLNEEKGMRNEVILALEKIIEKVFEKTDSIECPFCGCKKIDRNNFV